MTCFFMDSFESRMNPRSAWQNLRRGVSVVRAKSNRVRERNGRRFQLEEDGTERKEKSFCFVASRSVSADFPSSVFLLAVHALSSLVRLVTSLIVADFWSCVSSAKLSGLQSS